MKRYLLLLGGWILVIIIVIGTITILYHRHPYQKVLLPTGWKRKWFPSEARHHYLSPMMEVANGSIININIDVIVATFSFFFDEGGEGHQGAGGGGEVGARVHQGGDGEGGAVGQERGCYVKRCFDRKIRTKV